ncbi:MULTISPECIES: hypothetical protein [unclassified Bartonella]|uniref:hypothetical protein n=1 Tax=unclassified Bartonella TaxID=2645622 RepID=UPI0035D126E6
MADTLYILRDGKKTTVGLENHADDFVGVVFGKNPATFDKSPLVVTQLKRQRKYYLIIQVLMFVMQMRIEHVGMIMVHLTGYKLIQLIHGAKNETHFKIIKRDNPVKYSWV